MIEVVPDSDYQSLQHFVSHSPWESRLVMDQVAVDADRLFGGTPDVGLIIDETSFPKAGMQGQRYFVERAFQDAKCTAGMDHYQVRSWKSWHHHMSLVMMSMLFMAETRLEEKENYPLLSCPDVAKLLATHLPRRDADIDEVFRQMEVRHKQRQASIDSAYRRQFVKLDG